MIMPYDRYTALSDSLRWMPIDPVLSASASSWLAQFNIAGLLPDGIDTTAISGSGSIVTYTWTLPHGMLHIRLASNGMMVYRLIEGQRSTVKPLRMGTTVKTVLDLIRDNLAEKTAQSPDPEPVPQVLLDLEAAEEKGVVFHTAATKIRRLLGVVQEQRLPMPALLFQAWGCYLRWTNLALGRNLYVRFDNDGVIAINTTETETDWLCRRSVELAGDWLETLLPLIAGARG